MPDVHQLELLAEVAHLYYEEDYSQTEIAKMMNISHSTISRMLKKAKESGVVKVIIRYPLPSVPSLENELKARFSLKLVKVFPAADVAEADLLRHVSQLAARVIENIITDGMVFSVSLGSMVEATVKSLNLARPVRCRIAMLQGATEDETLPGNSYIQLLAGMFGGDLKTIPSPWVFKYAEICQILRQEPAVREALELAEKSDLALIGIGTTRPESSALVRSKYLTADEMNEIIQLGGVGEIFGKFYDVQGKLLAIDFNKRTVTLDIDQLRKIPSVIGAAVGEYKAPAILGAIRGGYINTLVTDSNLAARIIEMDKKIKRNAGQG